MFTKISCLLLVLALHSSHVLAQLPKKVFCHYLVGTVTSGSGHAEKDIDDAQRMGFDAFALNVFQPLASYSISTVQQLFTHANAVGFKLFFSLDAANTNNLTEFAGMVNQYSGNAAYFYQYGKPMLSTFDTGSGNGPAQWTTFLNSLKTQPYFIPDFDNDTATWGQPNDGAANPAFFDKWQNIPGYSGAFSWETAWPVANTTLNETTTKDVAVIQTAHSRQKAYMLPLSTFQFKHLADLGNYWRVGQVNLPQRMTDVLALGNNLPDFVEVITWNDGGEGHYIGNVWPEGSNYAYDKADHTGWQPLFTSFIQAYKNGKTASGMAPPSGSVGNGTMWYLPMLTTAKCKNDALGPPYGIRSARDAINYAVILPAGQTGQVRVYTAGRQIYSASVPSGLSYASVPGLQPGAQRLEVYNSAGALIMYATSAFNVTADNDNLCNFNYEVAGFKRA